MGICKNLNVDCGRVYDIRLVDAASWSDAFSAAGVIRGCSCKIVAATPATRPAACGTPLNVATSSKPGPDDDVMSTAGDQMSIGAP